MSTGPKTPLAPLETRERIARLLPSMEEASCDALLVTNLVNVRYLTGFSGSAAELFVSGEQALLTTDGRYRTQAAEQLERAGLAERVDLVIGKVAEQRSAISESVKRSGAKTVGLEAQSISWAGKRRLADLLGGLELVPTEGLVEKLREVKDDGELDRMRVAAHIADLALAEVLHMLVDGASEEEVALSLDTEMRRLGAEDNAFDTIVASGPNAAKPHARPSARSAKPKDPVVIDFGAMFDGYRSDMTRTFFVGEEPDGTMSEVLSVVADAQSTGVATVRSGVSASAVDKACRDVVAAAGMADRFEHGTGHGVGLDIHEAPAVAEGSTAILAPGFVVTVEPGVYLPGVGGVRIEDTVVVTEDGCSPLTAFTKDVVVAA